jgi:hypothetical protein
MRWNPVDHMNACAALKPASGGKNYGKTNRLIQPAYRNMNKLEYQLQQLEYEFETWRHGRHEWQYQALAAVETAIFEATP